MSGQASTPSISFTSGGMFMVRISGKVASSIDVDDFRHATGHDRGKSSFEIAGNRSTPHEVWSGVSRRAFSGLELRK